MLNFNMYFKYGLACSDPVYRMLCFAELQDVWPSSAFHRLEYHFGIYVPFFSFSSIVARFGPMFLNVSFIDRSLVVSLN